MCTVLQWSKTFRTGGIDLLFSNAIFWQLLIGSPVNDVDLRYLSEIRHLVFEYAGYLGAWKRGAQAGYLVGFLRGRRDSLS